MHTDASKSTARGKRANDAKPRISINTERLLRERPLRQDAHLVRRRGSFVTHVRKVAH